MKTKGNFDTWEENKNLTSSLHFPTNEPLQFSEVTDHKM